jgi:1-acyl-sn-glycerol-3-phosphate acyltransferase
MKTMNKTYLHDAGDNLKLLFDRNNDVGLLSISNHQSVLDDPGMWCGVIPIKKLRLDVLRTIVVAEEWFYILGNFSANILFGLNCLPIRRGDLRALERIPALKEMHQRLNGIATHESRSSRQKKKEWAHIMIEGRLYQSWRFQGNEPKLGKKFRRGAAKLIASSPPHKTIILPIYHRGMDEIFPEERPNGWEKGALSPGKTKSFFPKLGKRVDVYVGDPIDFTDLVPFEGYPFENSIEKNLLDEINVRLCEAMLRLESKASTDRTKY